MWTHRMDLMLQWLDMGHRYHQWAKSDGLLWKLHGFHKRNARSLVRALLWPNPDTHRFWIAHRKRHKFWTLSRCKKKMCHASHSIINDEHPSPSSENQVFHFNSWKLWFQTITQRAMDVWQIMSDIVRNAMVRCKQLQKEHIGDISPYFPGNSLQAATGWVPSHHRKPAGDPMGSMRWHSPDGYGHTKAWPISRNRLDDAKFLTRSRCFSLLFTFSDFLCLTFRGKESISDRFMSKETEDRKNRITLQIDGYW